MDDVLTWLKSIGLPAAAAALMFPILWALDKILHARSQHKQAQYTREEMLQEAENHFRQMLTEQIDSLRTEVHKMRNQLQTAYKHLDDCYAANGELRTLNAELRIEVVNLKAIVSDLRAKVDSMTGSQPTTQIYLPGT